MALAWRHGCFCNFLLACALFCFGQAAAQEAAPSNPNVGLLLRLQGADLAANAGLRATLQRTLDATVGTADFVELVRAFKVTDRDAALLNTALAHSSNSVGADAVRILLARGSVEEIRKVLAGPEAERAVEILGNIGEKSANDLVKPIISDPKGSRSLRESAVRAMVKNRDGAAWLLKLAQDKSLPEELETATARELAEVRWPEIKEAAARIFPVEPVKAVEPLLPVEEMIGREGDPALGERLFFESAASCSRCHQVRGQGVDFGPNLSEIGDKFGKDGLYAAILTPSAGISFGFEAWQVDFKNGDDTFGLIVSETAEEVTVKAVGGIISRYKKDSIARRVQQPNSIMPDGLAPALGTEGLVNLVEFLTTLRKPAE